MVTFQTSVAIFKRRICIVIDVKHTLPRLIIKHDHFIIKGMVVDKLHPLHSYSRNTC